MKKSFLFALVGLTAGTLLAQNPDERPGPPAGGPGGPSGPGGRGPRGGGSPIIRLLDVDKDGTISAAELAKASTALAALDTNKDGQLTMEETRPAGPGGPRPEGAGRPPGERPEGDRPPGGQGGQGGQPGPRPGFAPPLIAALDADKNGTISAAELANAATALKALDKNGDGALTPEELRGARPGGNRGPGGRPGPGPGQE